jgi:hypothetical protein
MESKVWLQKVALATYRAATELSCSLGEQNGSPSEPLNEAPAPRETTIARLSCSLSEQNLRLAKDTLQPSPQRG